MYADYNDNSEYIIRIIYVLVGKFCLHIVYSKPKRGKIN